MNETAEVEDPLDYGHAEASLRTSLIINAIYNDGSALNPTELDKIAERLYQSIVRMNAQEEIDLSRFSLEIRDRVQVLLGSGDI